MTLKAIRERTAYWQAQERLNLMEWTIVVQWLPVKAAREDDGTCEWSADTLLAKICIAKKTKHGHESALVHELLHLVLDGHADYEGRDVHRERAINRIVNALLNKGGDAN